MARKAAAAQKALLADDDRPADRSAGGTAVATGAGPAAGSAQPVTTLRIHRLAAKGFGGIPDGERLVIDFAPDVTVLRGENASNKSTILAALRCGLGIDRVAASRRSHIGQDGTPAKPEIEIELRGDDRELHVRRVGDGSPEVRERVGEDWRVVPRPVEWLRDLVDVQAAVPEGFIEASNDDRATMLLEALELPGYSRAEALAAAGLDAFQLPPIPEGLHPLEDLEKVMDAVFSSRTEVNRQRDTEAEAAKKLLAGLPAEAPDDPADQLAAAEDDLRVRSDDLARAEEANDRLRADAVAAAARELQAVRERSAARTAAQADALHAKHETVAAEIRAEAERRIADLAADVERQIAEARAVADAAIQGAVEAEAGARTAADKAHADARAELASRAAALGAKREAVAALREQQRTAAQDRHVRGIAAEALQKAEAHATRSHKLTAGLQALRQYAVGLAGKLPIKGLEVRYDDKGRRTMSLDGVPLDQLNTGRLRELADEVALLHAEARAGGRVSIPLILLEWMEQVDEGRRAEHLRALAARGAQVVAAVVAPGPLKVLRGEAAIGGEAAA